MRAQAYRGGRSGRSVTKKPKLQNFKVTSTGHGVSRFDNNWVESNVPFEDRHVEVLFCPRKFSRAVVS